MLKLISRSQSGALSPLHFLITVPRQVHENVWNCKISLTERQTVIRNVVEPLPTVPYNSPFFLPADNPYIYLSWQRKHGKNGLVSLVKSGLTRFTRLWG